MSIVKEVADALGAVAEGIEHIRTVATAVRDGVGYVKAQHPEIQKDLEAMCIEMRNTTQAVAAASAILTHFRFTVTGTGVDSEPARFNNHWIAHKEKAAHVSDRLIAMRGHCHVIRQHADQLRRKAQGFQLTRLLQLFGIDSAEREKQVFDALEDIYNEEMQGYRLVGQLTQALQRALKEVGGALGPAGAALPQNVPVAAALLGEYADRFSRLEASCNYIALDLQESIDALK